VPSARRGLLMSGVGAVMAPHALERRRCLVECSSAHARTSSGCLGVRTAAVLACPARGAAAVDRSRAARTLCSLPEAAPVGQLELLCPPHGRTAWG
jgi:hypothetical protein